MVREAAQSVLAQSYRGFELIVVDDGSTDGTSERIVKLNGAVRLFAQNRRGVSAARNSGATIARGRYLAFLDSDDLWLPDKLAVQSEFMAQRPEIHICQTEEIWYRRGVRVNPMAKHRKPSGDVFRPSLELCLISPSAVMMTRELFEASGGFDESLSVCEDYDLWLRVAARHPVPLISNALVVKRGGHADQLSHSTWGMDRYRVLALQKLLRSGLSREKRLWALEVLRRKVAVLAGGAEKRGNGVAADAYRGILDEFMQESCDVVEADSRICGGEGVSFTNSRAVAALG